MGGAVFTRSTAKPISRPCPSASRLRCAARSGNERDRIGHRARADKLPPVRRSQRGAPDHPHLDDKPRRRPRSRARAPVRARRLESVAVALRALREHADVQSAKLLLDNGRGNAAAARRTPGAEPDAEVSFVTRDLAQRPAAREDRGRRAARRRASRACATPPNWTGTAPASADAARLDAISPAARARLCAPKAATPIPMRGFEARIVPENITLLPKTADADRPAATPGTSARSSVKKGDSGRHHPARSRRHRRRRSSAHRRRARRRAAATAA